MTLQTTALGTLTFDADPAIHPPIRKEATRLSSPTWDGAQVKDRGFQSDQQGLVGLHLVLRWDIMAGSFFNALRAIYEHNEVSGGLQDLPIFDPGAWARIPGERYRVRIVAFDWDEDHLHEDYVLGPTMTFDIRGVL